MSLLANFISRNRKVQFSIHPFKTKPSAIIKTSRNLVYEDQMDGWVYFLSKQILQMPRHVIAHGDRKSSYL